MKSSFYMQKSNIVFMLSLIILLSSILWIAIVFFSQSTNSHIFNLKEFEKKYYESQWSIPNSKKPISDETLYTYAGYKYITGTNPILVNPEAPPLGKYIIGLSILLFNQQSILNIVAGLFCLVFIYLIIYVITSSIFYSSIGVFLTSINTLFIDQLIHTPQLEIFQLFFLLAIFICLIQYQRKKQIIWLISTGMLLGCFFSIKAFILHFFLAILWFGIYFFSQNKLTYKKNVVKLGFVLLIAMAVFAATYLGYFFHGGTLRGFLGVQKWIALFYQDSQIDKIKLLGSYIPLIFVNKWRFWSKGYPFISYSSWSVWWPILYMMGIYSLYIFRKNKLLWLFISFVIAYSLFLFFIPIFPRYLLLLFVPLTIISTIFLHTKTHKYLYEK